MVTPGARVEQFEKLCEVQSDKAAVDVSSDLIPLDDQHEVLTAPCRSDHITLRWSNQEAIL